MLTTNRINRAGRPADVGSDTLSSKRHTFFKKIAGLRSSVSRTRQLSLF